MKTRTCIIVLFLPLLIVCCSKNNTAEEDMNIMGGVTFVSDCKQVEARDDDRPAWDTLNCMLWDYNSAVKVLNMKHLNVFFNCCPGKITATIYEKNDTIFIMESEEENYCSCLCQYDVDMELTGVSKKVYQVELTVVYPWAWGLSNPLDFEMDLQTNPDGQYCW